MSRHKRIQIPGWVRHVMARGNGRMTIFLDDRDYRRFIYIMGEVLEELEVHCRNYCIMPNHYHATLLPQHPNLSEAMRRINSRYASWWNWRHQRVGHVFQGRFKGQIVQEDRHLFVLDRYVAMNPVRANLVERPEQWEWSSYAATAGLRPAPSFLAVDSVLEQFGDDGRRVRQDRYREHVLLNSEESAAIYDRIRSNERVIGDSDFKRTFDRARAMAAAELLIAADADGVAAISDLVG